MTNWIQTWANYYSHITRNMSAEETHVSLSKERDAQEKIITRAKEHLEGVALYYGQSHLADPHPPGEGKKGHQRPSDSRDDTIGKDPSQNTSKSADELSDRKI